MTDDRDARGVNPHTGQPWPDEGATPGAGATPGRAAAQAGDGATHGRSAPPVSPAPPGPAPAGSETLAGAAPASASASGSSPAAPGGSAQGAATPGPASAPGAPSAPAPSQQELAVRSALETVMDPEIGLSVIDLGLIREVRIEPGKTLVRMMLTTPFCPYAPQLMADVKQAAQSVVSQDCEVELMPDPWSPDLMPDPGLLGFSY